MEGREGGREGGRKGGREGGREGGSEDLDRVAKFGFDFLGKGLGHSWIQTVGITLFKFVRDSGALMGGKGKLREGGKTNWKAGREGGQEGGREEEVPAP
jgi:hypothetical protein